MRNLCKKCGIRPVAINYYRDGKTFYRSRCDHCAKDRKSERPKWASAGYCKRDTCDRCGFSSKYPDQFDVFYVDGNPGNCKYSNLKTVCANCQRILYKLKLPWRRGDLTPDF